MKKQSQKSHNPSRIHNANRAQLHAEQMLFGGGTQKATIEMLVTRHAFTKAEAKRLVQAIVKMIRRMDTAEWFR